MTWVQTAVKSRLEKGTFAGPVTQCGECFLVVGTREGIEKALDDLGLSISKPLKEANRGEAVRVSTEDREVGVVFAVGEGDYTVCLDLGA